MRSQQQIVETVRKLVRAAAKEQDPESRKRLLLLAKHNRALVRLAGLLDRRKRLEKLALERLHDPANEDPTQLWAYVFGSDYSLFGWCPWDEYDDGWPADYGIPDDLDLPWSEERRGQLEENDAGLSETELRLWRCAMCRSKARHQPDLFALIKPMKMENDKIEAYEVWLDMESNSLSGEPPRLFGVFDTLDEAKDALLKDGATE